MKFILIDKKEYEQLLRQYFYLHSNYRMYHSLEWLSFIGKTQNLNAKYIKIIENDECIGIFPFFEIKFLFFKIFVSPLEGWSTGYIDHIMDSKYYEKFFSEFKKYLKKKYLYAQFSIILDDSEKFLAQKAGFLIESQETYITPLYSSEDEIIMGYTKSTSKSVSQAIRKGLIVEESTNRDEFFDVYYD